MKRFEEKYPYVWLLLGLVLTLFSYGIFNTGICAWLFAIPLIRYINIRTKWSSIFLMLLGTIVVANITFCRLVSDEVNIMNQVFCTFNGIRIWGPFFVYFLCRRSKTNNLVAYFSFPATVAVCEFFIDNPFVSVMTSLSVSQFWNLGLMQFASITGVVGVSFIVTFLACVVNYIWEEGLVKKTIVCTCVYGIALVMITGIGMSSVKLITTGDETVRVATSVYCLNIFADSPDILLQYEGSTSEKLTKASIDIIDKAVKDAVYNRASILVFPEIAFWGVGNNNTDELLNEVCRIAKENSINILLPVAIYPVEEAPDEDDLLLFAEKIKKATIDSGKKEINTLNFIDRNGNLVNTYWMYNRHR